MGSQFARGFLILLWAVPLFAEPGSKTALIEELLQLTGADKLADTVLDQQKALLKQELSDLVMEDDDLAPYKDKLEPVIEDYQRKIVAMVKKAMDWTQVKPQMIKIYDELFTEKELAAIVAFDKTPAGQALIQKTPGITEKSMDIGMRQLSTIMPDIQGLSTQMKVDMKKAIISK
jgi:uncharacterized protein